MNILTAATIDFVTSLRNVSTGWCIDPLVMADITLGRGMHNGLLCILKPPRSTSPTEYFINKQPADSDYSIIRIKIPNKQLRLIKCHLTVRDTAPVVRLHYFRAEGFRQNEDSIRAYYIATNASDIDYNTITAYNIATIERVTKGTKNRGKKRPGTPNVIHRDTIDISVPTSASRCAAITKAMIEKSFDKCFETRSKRRDIMAVVIDDLNFSYSDSSYISARVVYK